MRISRWLAVGLMILSWTLSGAAYASGLPLSDVTKEGLVAYRGILLFAHSKITSLDKVDVTALVVPQQALITSGAVIWKQKRLEMDVIKQAVAEIDVHFQQWIPVMLRMSIRDESDFTASLKIPSSFEDYLFLENDGGQFVRASSADLPMLKDLSAFNPAITVHVLFPASLPEGGGMLITEETKAVSLTVSGLSDTEDLRFEWTVPLIVPEAPQALQKVIDMANLTRLYEQPKESGDSPED